MTRSLPPWREGPLLRVSELPALCRGLDRRRRREGEEGIVMDDHFWFGFSLLLMVVMVYREWRKGE